MKNMSKNRKKKHYKLIKFPSVQENTAFVTARNNVRWAKLLQDVSHFK